MRLVIYLRLLYISNINIGSPKSIGIIKKVFGQIESFHTLNYSVDLLFEKNNRFFFYDTNLNSAHFIRPKPKDSFLNTIRRKDSLGYLEQFLNTKSYDIVYLRFVALNIGTLLFFKTANTYSDVTILEIPTYPYLKEQLLKLKRNNFLSGLRLIKQVLIDYVIKIILKKYVKLIVLTIPKKKLWRIPVVSIENGIHLSAIRIHDKKSLNDHIILFTATNIDVWQGLDRLVIGLHNYFKTNILHPNITIKIAGEGFEKDNLLRLSRKYGLEKNIIFCGAASGKKLRALYDEADIAIGSLGRHRQKTNTVSTLKAKEFCAKGIPFIYSNDEPSLTGKEIFALKLPANDDPIDFSEILKFYEQIRKQPDLKYKIRKFSEKYDWLNQVRLIHQKALEIR